MHIPFVILAALQEEAEVILGSAETSRRMDDTLGLSQAYLVKVNGVREKGVVVVLPGMGRLHAANAAIHAICKWRPEFILVVGIAGGFRRRGLQLGDVLVTTAIHDYERQKLASTTRRIRWQTYTADPLLLKIAHQAALSSDSGVVKVGGKVAKVHFGPVLSGDKIVASQSFADRLLSASRDSMGIEMEGAGVAFAASQYSVPMLMIRGIADFADEHKRQQMNKWRAAACEASAMFVFSFLRVWSQQHRD